MLYLLSCDLIGPCVCAAAGLMHKFQAHAATDVTGFGLLGHANNLAAQQQSEVAFVIHNLPIIAKMAAVSKACGNIFNLVQGTSAETSGTEPPQPAGDSSPAPAGEPASNQWVFCRWTPGVPPQGAGRQVLLGDEEPERGRPGRRRRRVDHRHRGERRPPRSHHRQAAHHRGAAAREPGGQSGEQHGHAHCPLPQPGVKRRRSRGPVPCRVGSADWSRD